MNVYAAINAVQADLVKTGIGKDSENKFDGYKFRGIDAVYNAVSPLLAKHGLCILPRMLSRSCEERTSQKGGALFYVTVEAEFDFVSAVDGSKHTVKTYGEAMDRGDKATNKAMSAAYKYAAFQTFAIPTEGDNDADAASHEVAAKPAPNGYNKNGTAKAGTEPHAPAKLMFEALKPEEQDYLRSVGVDVISLLAKGKAVDAYERIQEEGFDQEQRGAFNHLLDSKQRGALREVHESRKVIA